MTIGEHSTPESGTNGDSLRVIVAEDSVLVLEGLIGILTRFGHEIVATLPDATGITDTIEQYQPDILITDVRMPPGFGEEGLRAALALRERFPRFPVLLLSQYFQRVCATELMNSCDGVGVGYLLKERIGHLDSFIDALHTVAGGGTVLDPEILRQVVRRRQDPLERLSRREREVLGLVAEGRSNGAIAGALSVSEGAVGKHISGILNKLDLPPDEGIHRRVLAVRAYLRA